MLTDRERQVLDVEGRQWLDQGRKAEHVRAELGLTPTAYYQLLNALIVRPEALMYAPVTVNRLLRVRESRRRLRSARIGIRV